jgi:outer membrane lipoprotein-sorting protein
MNHRTIPAFVFGTFLFLQPLAASAQNIQQVVKGMQNRWNNIRDASAVIEIQTWDKTEEEKVNVFYGQIYYLAPKLVRLEYSPAPESATGPSLYPFGKNKYIYIHDGKDLWRYSHSKEGWFNQFGDDPVISMVNQIADINNFNVDRFLQIYQIADVTRAQLYEKFPTYLVRAEPKRKGGAHPRQLLWIHQTTYLPVEAVMARQQNEVSCFFHNIKQNPGLPATIFSVESQATE